MENSNYKKIVNKILEGIKNTENVLKDAVNCEFTDFGHKIELEDLKQIFKEEKIMEVESLKNKKLSILYSGNPEITISFILFALKNNTQIYLCSTDGYTVINNSLVTLVLECLKELKIKNNCINYSEEYDEDYFKRNENNFDFRIYIGDYFEYNNLMYFMKKDVEFYSYEFMKLFINKAKYKKEYKEIMKYCYTKNISVDVYENPDDFLENINVNDEVVIFVDEDKKDIFDKYLKANKVYWNEFPYDNYKFKINEILINF